MLVFTNKSNKEEVVSDSNNPTIEADISFVKSKNNLEHLRTSQKSELGRSYKTPEEITSDKFPVTMNLRFSNAHTSLRYDILKFDNHNSKNSFVIEEYNLPSYENFNFRLYFSNLDIYEKFQNQVISKYKFESQEVFPDDARPLSELSILEQATKAFLSISKEH